MTVGAVALFLRVRSGGAWRRLPVMDAAEGYGASMAEVRRLVERALGDTSRR